MSVTYRATKSIRIYTLDKATIYSTMAQRSPTLRKLKTTAHLSTTGRISTQLWVQRFSALLEILSVLMLWFSYPRCWPCTTRAIKWWRHCQEATSFHPTYQLQQSWLTVLSSTNGSRLWWTCPASGCGDCPSQPVRKTFWTSCRLTLISSLVRCILYSIYR